jgi:putative phage-type endonuclease
MSLTQEQHDARAKGIGGSEAAAACGISPWKTIVQLYQEKIGEVPPPNLDDNELVLWGGLLEDVIAQEWARRHKQTVHRVNVTKVSPKYPFMLGNIDRRIVGKREGLEIKNASQWTNEAWGEPSSDDVPLYYLTQGVHYMHVYDYDAWNYGVLLGGNQLLSYRVERDSEIERQIIAQEERFWECVTLRRPPPPQKVEDLTRLYKKTHGRVTATPEILELVADAREINATMKPLKARLEEIKLQVGAFMGPAGDLFDPVDLSLLHATYRAHDETRIDGGVAEVKKRLKPQIVDAIQAAIASTTAREMGQPLPNGHPQAVQVAMLEKLGAEAFAELIVASIVKTSPVRKFLAK